MLPFFFSSAMLLPAFLSKPLPSMLGPYDAVLPWTNTKKNKNKTIFLGSKTNKIVYVFNLVKKNVYF